MFDLVETYRAKLDYPVEVVERTPETFTPLVRAAELYAHRSQCLGKPFQLLRHRGRTYALVAVSTTPFGWLSRIVSGLGQGYSAQQKFRVWGYFDVDVATVSLGPGSVLIVDATRFGANNIEVGLCRYMYQEPSPPTK